MTKHTPSPWKLEGTMVYALEHHGWKNGKEQVTNRFSACLQKGPTISKEELEANAQIMKAAPDLFQALKDLTKSVQAWNESVEQIIGRQPGANFPLDHAKGEICEKGSKIIIQAE